MDLKAIETHSLTKRYRESVALRDVHLSISPGSIYALVGPNGSGKTTLIRLLMNMARPSRGRATVLGWASTDMSGRDFERIGYISENQELLDSFSIQGFLDFVRPFYPKWDGALEAQLVQQFGLPLKRKLKHLSRGMRMKAALASVLPFRPALIVLDEPFSGLDPLVRDELIESLKEMRGDTTIFLSSHDLSEVESFATHVGFLEQGSLLFSESLPVLLGRFREIEILRSEGNSTDPIGEIPAAWLNFQIAGNTIRFTHSEFAEETQDELSARFSNAVNIGINPMPLRSIFVTIARSGRRAIAEHGDAS